MSKNKNIFVSYIEEDHEIAELIAKKLSDEGFSPWAYTVNGSSKWKRQVVIELKQCEIMILVFSKKTNDKADKQIVKELGLASEYEKEIIPLMIDEITPKDITNEEIAYEVVGGNITWIGKEEPLEKQVQTLISRINKYYGEEYSSKNMTQYGSEKNKIVKPEKEIPSWKYLIGVLGAVLVFAFGYLGYINYNKQAIPARNPIDVPNALGKSDDPNGLKNNKFTANMDDNVDTLSVSNIAGSNKGWHSELFINSSNPLNLDIHYNTKYMGAENLKVYLDDITNKVYEYNEELIVKARLTANNLSDSTGKVKIKFDEKVKLVFKSISWQKWPCRAVSCESSLKDNINHLFSKEGLSIGNILKTDDTHYSGNIVVIYDVVKAER